MNRMGNAAAAAGAAGVGAAALAGLGYGLIQVEAKLARKIVGQPFDGAPDDDGVYGAAPGAPLELVVLGDSSAAGMGADNRYQTIGAILATGLAAMTGRPVNLTNEAVIGAESSDLDRQLALALARTDRVDAAVVLIGAAATWLAGWIALGVWTLLVVAGAIAIRRSNSRYTARHSRYTPRHA